MAEYVLDNADRETEQRFASLESCWDPVTIAHFERIGVDEVTTFRDEVRVRPVALDDAAQADLKIRVPEATYHRTTQTLNIAIDQTMGGTRLPGWVEGALREAV